MDPGGNCRVRVQYAYIEKPKIDQTSLRQPKVLVT